jgi:hypothetical protein
MPCPIPRRTGYSPVSNVIHSFHHSRPLYSPLRAAPPLYVPRLVRGIQLISLMALHLDPANKSRDVEKKSFLFALSKTWTTVKMSLREFPQSEPEWVVD